MGDPVFIQQLCDERHGDVERRLDAMEKLMESVSTELMRRLPPWATFMMTGLGTLCGGLIVAFLTKK